MTENKITNDPQSSPLAEEPTHYGRLAAQCGAGPTLFITLDPARVTCEPCRLEAPMQRDPNEAARGRYWITGRGRDVLERDDALARTARYERRLREVEALIEHNREVMVDYAKRLGEAMALRERIVRELSATRSAEQGSVGTSVGVAGSEPGKHL